VCTRHGLEIGRSHRRIAISIVRSWSRATLRALPGLTRPCNTNPARTAVRSGEDLARLVLGRRDSLGRCSSRMGSPKALLPTRGVVPWNIC